MNIKKIRTLYFSPTGHTAEVARLVAGKMAQEMRCPVEEDSFTLPAERNEKRTFAGDELAVFALPTYAGRVPNKILPFLQTLFEGSKTPAVALVTFGNRSFDESLKELCVELKQHGFIPFAAAALVCPHAMSGALAKERPDANDLKQMETFALDAAKKLLTAEELPDAVRVSETEEVGPYYRPLEESGEPANFLKAKPVTDMTLCDRCGICARVCPMGSIDPEDVSETPGICIKCHACVRKCPVHAKSFDDRSLISHIKMLEKTYARPAENALFL